MITAVLADVADDGSPFNAYMLKGAMNQRLPVRTIDEYEGASAWGFNYYIAIKPLFGALSWEDQYRSS